jgi:anti-sigma factor RsiW
MRCERAQALMDRYHGEDLSPHERESFEIHLRDCRACQKQLASLQRLVSTLQGVPAPPVPRDLLGRVMASARQEIQAAQGAPAPRWAISRWWEDLGVTGLANALTAVSAGLLLGLALGQQTWRHAASSKAPSPQTAAVDTEAVYALDYLSGTPRGSFTETYLSLTSAATDQEPF